MKTSPAKRSPRQSKSSVTSAQPVGSRPSTQWLFLPLLPIIVLASFGLLPRIRSNAILLYAFNGTSIVLLSWWTLLRLRVHGRALKVDILLRPEHYMQTVAQLAIYIYWGIYWQPIRDAAALLAAQVLFAYAFDMLLTWSRRETYILSFGPFPIIFSINLFLRFHDDFFYLQFVLVAVAFLAKEFIRWNKDGRRVHIFNPSSFPLALASVVLLLTHSTQLTWGQEIATLLFLPPHIYLFLFLVSLPGQYRFGISTMSLSAVVTVYGFGLAYFAATGTYFFIDSYIPIAVFLGMLLLVVDPATAPRTELGRIIFGAFYGASTLGLYAWLFAVGAPTFYDKLLQIPIMNLSVQMIDRAARSPALAWLDPARLGRGLRPSRRNLAYTSMWVVVFTAMSFAQGLGDTHRGQFLPFWQQACKEGRRHACENVAVMEGTRCLEGSGWACNELAIRIARENQPNNLQLVTQTFGRACAAGFEAGCRNAQHVNDPGALDPAPPELADYSIILRGGKGPLPDRSPFEVYSRACAQGFESGCEGRAFAYLRGEGVMPDATRAARQFDDICLRGAGSACFNAAMMYHSGDGVVQDEARATDYLRKACERGFIRACGMLRQQPPKTQN